jgi:hypothetical protein
MIAYWALFLLPLAGVLMPGPLSPQARRLTWFGMTSFTVLIVGLRHEIGADWPNYEVLFDAIASEPWPHAIFLTDPGYGLINKLAAELGWGIYGVNFICAVIFAAGLTTFALRQPFPWLAWLIATPYVLIVVVMGYSRQGVALGLAFAALACLQERRTSRFIALIIAGALFHKSAALLLPLAFLAGQKAGWLRNLGLLLTIVAAALALLFTQLETLWSIYIEDQLVSEGATIRVWMNALPAILLIALARRRRDVWSDPGFWRYVAWGAIICIPLVGLASTAIDRVALYLTPLQVFVWSRVPLLFRDSAERTSVVIGLSVVYAAILWIWLNYAAHAYAWIPYRNLLFSH